MNPARCHYERGYSMIELSVALVMALFLLAGILVILQNTRSASDSQNGLAQLQDDERMAMTLITDVVQQAGYYPDAQTTDPTERFPPSATFATAGQTIHGARNPTAAYGDTITVRYQGDASNSVLDCRGAVVADGATEEMTFSVQENPNNDGSWLYCTVNGTSVPLVPHISSLAIRYGIDSDNSGSVNAYLPADLITAALWSNVFSVKITVSFTNPLSKQPGQALRTTLPFARVISVQQKTGYNVLNLF